MAKQAIRALGASLRQELLLEGAGKVHVCTVLPASAERVARAIVDVVRVPRREVVVGPMGRAVALQSRTAPGLLERAAARQVDRAHLSREEPAPAPHGNPHGPAPGAGSVDGGWRGRRRTTVRRLALAATAVGAAVGAGRRVAAR